MWRQCATAVTTLSELGRASEQDALSCAARKAPEFGKPCRLMASRPWQRPAPAHLRGACGTCVDAMSPSQPQGLGPQPACPLPRLWPQALAVPSLLLLLTRAGVGTAGPPAAAQAQVTPVGLEPTIPGSVGRCLIHWATGPCGKCRRVDDLAPVYHCGDDFVRAGESKRAGHAELRSEAGTRGREALQAHGQLFLAAPGSGTPERGLRCVRGCHVTSQPQGLGPQPACPLPRLWPQALAVPSFHAAADTCRVGTAGPPAAAQT